MAIGHWERGVGAGMHGKTCRRVLCSPISRGVLAPASHRHDGRPAISADLLVVAWTGAKEQWINKVMDWHCHLPRLSSTSEEAGVRAQEQVSVCSLSQSDLRSAQKDGSAGRS
jgi:hypothetical protein